MDALFAINTVAQLSERLDQENGDSGNSPKKSGKLPPLEHIHGIKSNQKRATTGSNEQSWSKLLAHKKQVQENMIHRAKTRQYRSESMLKESQERKTRSTTNLSTAKKSTTKPKKKLNYGKLKTLRRSDTLKVLGGVFGESGKPPSQLRAKFMDTKGDISFDLEHSRTSSFQSNEAFYIRETKKLRQQPIYNKLRENPDSGLKKYILNKSKSQSMLQQSNNWKKTLRDEQHSKLQFDLTKPKMKKNMTLKHISPQKKKVKDITQINVMPITHAERKRQKHQREHWSQRHGNVSSTTALVAKDDFHRLYDAFQAASKKSRHSEAYISDKEIRSIAKRLGIACSEKEARKMADIFDEDGSRHITFAEMVSVIKRQKNTNCETFLGAGMTLELLLIANRRRNLLENILKEHKKHHVHNSQLSDNGNISPKTNRFSPTSKASRISTRSGKFTKDSNNRNIGSIDSDGGNISKPSSLRINFESIEADSYLRKRQYFDSKTRKHLICHECNKEFDQSKLYEDHILEHKYNKKYFTCYQCGEKWIPINERNNHIMAHKNNKETLTRGDTTSNQNSKNKDPQLLSNLSTLMSIGNDHEKFKCQYCKQVFPSREVLQYHHITTHRPLSLDIFRCTFCDESFDAKNKVLKHQQEFHTSILSKSGTIGLSGTKNSNNQSYLHDILDDYDSDNDMSPEEYMEKRKAFARSESRKELKYRVSHLGHILDFRQRYDMDDRTVEKLEIILNREDQIRKTQNVMGAAALITSKFTEIVTEDETGTITNSMTDFIDNQDQQDQFYV